MSNVSTEASRLDIGGGVHVAIEDRGSGKPLVFLHGVMMSRRFFPRQRCLAEHGYRFVSFDFPGHGDSDDPGRNHTVAQYAKVLDAVLCEKQLDDVILVGWSMGAFVAWQYLCDFGAGRVSGMVVIDEALTDLRREDYEHAPLDLAALQHFMELVQVDSRAVADSFMSLMFKEEVQGDLYRTLHAEIMKVRPTTAGAILFDQTFRDYRDRQEALGGVPHLLCFGRDEKLVTVAAAEDMHRRIAGSRLVLFDDSGHCPFLEEPDTFNQALMDFSAAVQQPR